MREIDLKLKVTQSQPCWTPSGALDYIYFETKRELGDVTADSDYSLEILSLLPWRWLRSIGKVRAIWSATAMQYCLSLQPASSFPWPIAEGAVQTSTWPLCLPWGSVKKRDSQYNPTVREANSCDEGIRALNSTVMVTVGNQLEKSVNATRIE